MKSLTALLAVIGIAALAGCTANQAPAASSGPATPAAPTVTSSSPAASAQPSPAATTAVPVATLSPAPAGSGQVPVLGQLAGVFAQGQGFGQVKPARIFNGGDPTGLVTHVVWKSWGGSKAVATGVSEWVGPGQSVATGTTEPVRVVAFHLGVCSGKLMYQAIEWYFPQHGQSFQPGHYEDICTGTYVPAQ